ncbi:MAG TPA: TetR/AcrR family transcriptional regulator [Acidimicrobiia bacterium]|nr:TetR/AcrR family transcriptional regulator [Acidimicrobiia bacterium]HTC81824.1 TetR/AcrR family transcriptional regulator [Acidimicrobiia bacterium]
MATTATPANRHKERSELSTRRLLDAAGELIVEGGYEAMTLAAVGERAGYSRGLVTARFGSKDQLLKALVERIIDRWNHRNVLPRAEGSSGREAIVILLDAITEQVARDPSAIRVLYALMFEALGPVPELRSTFVAFHSTMRADLARLVRKGLRDGSVRPGTSPANEAALIVAGLRGVAYQWRLDPDGFDPLPVLRHLRSTTDDRLRSGHPAAG